MSSSQGTRFEIKKETSFTELVENREAVILDLENLHYYTLNGAASTIWRWIRQGEVGTLQEVLAALEQTYALGGGGAGPLEQEVQEFLSQLERNGLLVSGEGPSHPLRKVSERKAAAGDRDLPYLPPQLTMATSLSRVTLSGSSTIATAAISSVGG
jgi:hypothetical protein